LSSISGGIRVGAVNNRRGSVISGARFALFLIRQRHRAQRENFVDFGSIEQVAGTLRGDRRIVLENDG
jgi:hypothetical protein